MGTHRFDDLTGLLLAIAIIAGTILWLFLRIRPRGPRLENLDQNGAPKVKDPLPEAEAKAVVGGRQIELPAGTQLRHRLFDRWLTRDAFDWEWNTQYSADTNEFIITFFVERSPAVFDIWFLTNEPIRVDRLTYAEGDKLKPVDFGVRRQREGDYLRLLVIPVHSILTTQVHLYLSEALPDAGGRINIRLNGKNQYDMTLVRAAHLQANRGDLSGAIGYAHRYAARSTENPSISYWLSDWYRQLGKLDTAERYALRAVLHGNVDTCTEKYREVQRNREPRSIGEIRDLQDRAKQWPLGAHHGLLVIERHQKFVLGLDNCHLKKSRHLIEIRRAAAARMLSELSFPFSAAKELVLFTSMRVIHSDDTVEEVPLEHFTIGDQESKNILITIEDEKAGHWILPDLEPGDVIDWTYHLLSRNREIDGSPQVFILTSLFDGYSPTFHARSEFVAPKGQPIQFSMRNGDIAESRSAVDGKDVVVFESQRFVPSTLTVPSFSTPICRASCSTWRKASPTAAKFSRRNLQIVSWSGCVSPVRNRTATSR